MSRSIPVRNLKFALSENTPRYWYDKSAAKTHFMNALSTTFPFGEAFFVRSVQHFRDRIEDPELLERIRGFSGQEAVHSREHGQHVALLVSQGYDYIEKVNARADRQLRFMNRWFPYWALAETAALEHLTAIMAHQALADPNYWAGPMHEDMASLWQWHAMEEAEHKSVAFDVFQQVSGNWLLRSAALISASIGLGLDNLLRWAYFMHRDKRLGDIRAWAETWHFVMAPGGMYRRLLPDYVRWFRRDFHPDQRDDRELIADCQARLALSS